MDKPEKILAAALKLFVTYGFHGTPTSKIAREAGVSNGTLFHYFKTKDELVVALYTAIQEQQNQHLTTASRGARTISEKFRSLFVSSVEWALVNREAFYFIQQFHFSPHLGLISEEEIRKQREIHAQLFREGQEARVFKALPPDLIATLFVNQINGVYQYLINDSRPPTEQPKLIDDMFELTWTLITYPEIQ
jgi:AcrR family transcriptional regulator